MRTDRGEDVPDHLEALVVRQDVLRLQTLRDHDRDDDVAVLLPRRLPHHAADGLDDLDEGVFRREERDGVEAGDVHALGQALRVG